MTWGKAFGHPARCLPDFHSDLEPGGSVDHH